MRRPDFDIVVVGGGIHGAGVAQAAAAKGYRVLVLEKNRIAGGTSSRSSKLIHGGLRYLETGQITLVRESLHERELLLRNAPDLVKRIPFYIPVYKNSQRGRFKIALGLSLYAWLGGLKAAVRFRHVPRSDWGRLDGLKTENLEAVFQYWDAQTDDQKLTQAVLRSALELGAVLHLPARFEAAVREGGAYRIDYFHEEQAKTCRAAAFINAAGPWVDQVLARIEPAVPRIATELVQGTHILLAGRIDRGIYYLESHRDKRPVFVMPWKNRIMVGTTETVFKGNPSAVKPLDEEKDDLLEVLADYFPQFRSIQSAQILSAFSGLRVLPLDSGSFNARSRETLLKVDDALRPRLLTIYGGKLTTYRSTAESVIRRLAECLPQRKVKANTKRLFLKPGQGRSTDMDREMKHVVHGS